MAPTLVAQIADRGALARIVRAALLNDVVHVPLLEPPAGAGAYTLQVRFDGTPGVSLAAETAGMPVAQGYPLRLRPLDPTHVPELSLLAGGSARLPSLAAVDAVGDAAIDETTTSQQAVAPRVAREDVLAMRVGEEDTLTVPERPSELPAGTKTARGVGGGAQQAQSPGDTMELEAISVDFGDDDEIRAGGGVVLTPTEPFPPAGPEWKRVALDTRVDHDSTTLHSAKAASSGRGGPRTQKRQYAVIGRGRVIAHKYRIEAHIGSGAVGAVYRASHADLGREVAIKVLHAHCRSDPELLASFRAEARAASLLVHPNVTVVHDFGADVDGTVYIVMEYLAGTTLQLLLDEMRRLEPARAIAIMMQVCAALAAAHERGIIHRDVKPDNIMLVPARDDEGAPYELAKVCDFGIAALAAPDSAGRGGADAEVELTAGTPEYMAPEQAYGRADARTDVYACGIVLYEMLCGRPPFVGDSPKEILHQHESVLPRPLGELVAIGEPLEAIVMHALDKDPARRFQSMRELRGALKSVP